MKWSYIVSAIVVIVMVFRGWFYSGLLVGNDSDFYFTQVLKDMGLNAYSWDSQRGVGLGGTYLPFLWPYFVLILPKIILAKYFSLQWVTIERIVYFFLYLFFTAISVYFITIKYTKSVMAYFFAYFLYATNTYILMLLQGGQMQIALAYALAPLVVAKSFDTIHILAEKKILMICRSSVFAGLILSIEAMFDIRIAYITIVALCILLIGHYTYKEILKQFVFVLCVPIGILLLLNLFWLLPTVLTGATSVDQLGSNFSTSAAVQFNSFAKIENTISLLHPNWPENIFGKTYFMRPAFLLLPLLAFSSLLFISKKKKQETMFIIYFVMLSLLGIFLAKGTNDPFGGVYLWAFEHVPGFMLFRDPTKWYLFIALGYTVLIPFTIQKIYEKLQTWQKIYIFLNRVSTIPRLLGAVFIFTVAIIFILLILPAVNGGLGGTFSPQNVPQEYITLEHFLSSQPNFFRTLWLPTVQRFSYYSSMHPALPAENFFATTTPRATVAYLKKPNTQQSLQELGVKYVIVPDDSQKNIFITDRKYDNSIYINTVAGVKNIPWLKEIGNFGKIKVFQLNEYKEHFWSPNSLRIYSLEKNPTQYSVNIIGANQGNIVVFSESFDAHWEMITSNGTAVVSEQYANRYNSFHLPSEGSQVYQIIYTPQVWVDRGLVISGTSMAGFLVFCCWTWFFKKRMIK